MQEMCSIKCCLLLGLAITCAASAQVIERPVGEENANSANRLTQPVGVFAARPPYDPLATLRRTGRFERAPDLPGHDSDYVTYDGTNKVLVNSPSLQFLSPAAEAETETWQIFSLKYTINGYALPFKMGVVEADSEHIQLFPFPGFVVTDENGIARFMARSDTEILHGATLKVTIDSNVVAKHYIQFFTPNEDVSPHLRQFRMNSASRPVELQIDPIRIGLLTAAGVGWQTVNDWAARLLLTVEKRLNDNFYIINTGMPLTQNSRWWLARELKRFSSEVRSAGLLVRHESFRNPVILDPRIYIRIKPDADIHTVLDGLPMDSINSTDYGVNEFIVQSDYFDPLWLSMYLANLDSVIYAHPDVAQVIEERDLTSNCDYAASSWEPWCDVRYKKQWHLENTGQGNTLPDADADVRKAWDFSLGSKQTLITVIDTSFFLEQPDLEPNLWTHPSLGIRGYDLVDGDHSSLLFEWDVDAKTFRHGTSAAGLAAAQYGPNSEGGGGDVVGVCPDCMLLPIRVPLGEVTDDMKKAFDLAAENESDVVSMSLGFQLTPDNVTYDIEATGQNAVLVFAMSNEERENCGEVPDSASLESVIAVGGVTDYDEKSYKVDEAMGFGDCMDVVAPTRGGEQGISTTNVTTNDLGQPVPHILDDFGGTSAATPQVAGAAALVLDLVPLCQSPVLSRAPGPCLTPLQVRMILQDTADKVEQDKANYSMETGFSDPLEDLTSTHGYGRINTFEAVKLVASVNNGGSENKDLFLRDHQWDWGNTEQRTDIRFNIAEGSNPVERELIDLLKSVDMKIDVGEDSGFDSASSLQSFNELTHEDPQPGTPFDLYVRLRNRGQMTVSSAKLLVHWAVFADELPKIDFNIWEESTAPIADMDRWHTLSSQQVSDIAYSGASVAGCFESETAEPAIGCPQETGSHFDRAEVVIIKAPGGLIWDASKEHLALLAVVDSDEDKIQARRANAPSELDPESAISHVIWDNNVTLWARKQPVEGSNTACAGDHNPTASGNGNEQENGNGHGQENGSRSGQENGVCENVCGEKPYLKCWVIGILLIIVIIFVAWRVSKARSS